MEKSKLMYLSMKSHINRLSRHSCAHLQHFSKMLLTLKEEKSGADAKTIL